MEHTSHTHEGENLWGRLYLSIRLSITQVHPSIHPEGFPGWHDRNGLKFDMLMYPVKPQNQLDFGHGSLIFLILGQF